MEDEDILKEINIAATFNGFGIIGLIIPFVAWICCGIAISRISNLRAVLASDDNIDDYIRSRIGSVQATSIILILLSIASGCIWYAITTGG
jgi:hypothetical protein